MLNGRLQLDIRTVQFRKWDIMSAVKLTHPPNLSFQFLTIHCEIRPIYLPHFESGKFDTSTNKLSQVFTLKLTHPLTALLH